MRIFCILGFGKCIFVTHQSMRCHISDAQYVFHKLLLFVEQLTEETTTPFSARFLVCALLVSIRILPEN